jgi:hypothetical protein
MAIAATKLSSDQLLRLKAAFGIAVADAAVATYASATIKSAYFAAGGGADLTPA